MAAVQETNPHLHYDAGCYTKACECISQAIWGWFDEPVPPAWKMENKKVPSTQQPLPQHVVQHHHPGEQMYTHQHPQLASQLSSPQSAQYQPNGMMQQLLQSQYQSNIDARSPLLDNRQELAYGTTYGYDYKPYPTTNDNYNIYPQSPQRHERTDLQTDQNVNHELLQNIPKGYNAEVYQDYLRRNPPKDTNQIYQNHQPMYRPNISANQQTNPQGSKPYLPYSNRVGPQSNTELLRRQYNEIQQLKMQQQMHYQSQAQMQQQQKFAERQLLLQQIHGVQPPPNLQNSIYSDGSFRDIYSSKSEFRDFNKADIQKEVDRYAKNNEFKEIDKQQTQYPQEPQWQSNHHIDFERFKQYEGEKLKNQSQSQSPDYNNQKNNVGVVSPMKSSESNSPSIRSPSSESRKSSSGSQTIRSPIAQRSPSAPVTMCGILYKQGSDGLKVWRKRWFVLSEYCLFYYKSQEEEKLLGSVLLPSYKVSACTAEDKVLRKFAFKLEHANMRTYVLAAPDQESMLKWVKALTMAALMQNLSDQHQKQSERTAAKVEDNDDVPGPTYANAPPKPRRSNEGYNSPSPEMYDPNYDLLKKPASHYSLGTGHNHTNSQINQESIYNQNPQSPPQQPYQKRPYDPHNMSLPLTNKMPDTTDLNQPGPSGYRTNQSSYFDNRNRPQEQIYDRQPKRSSNPFIHDPTSPDVSNEKESQNQNYRAMEQERSKNSQIDDRIGPNIDNSFNRDVYGDAMVIKANKHVITPNDRLATDRRTPDAYSKAVAMANYNKGKMGDYEDVYGQYDEYGRPYSKTTSPPQLVKDSVANQMATDYSPNYPQEKTFNGPSVLRRKKQQASGIQPQVPRPHSADFLEYESRNEILNKTMPYRTAYEPPKQPQRPKSSLDINSYYDPSSDRYYSEESYAQKMRQSAQYLRGIAPKNIQIPLAKYASGLAEKQLETAYSQNVNNNYEAEFSTGRNSRANITPNTNFRDKDGFHSNWTLKGKGLDSQSLGYMNRSGSAMSNGSNRSGVKDQRLDASAEGFSRSLSARLSSYDKDGDNKVQQREESMKRLLEWKQRMLQSPLTRKTTPNGIFLDPVKKSSRDHYGTKRDARYNSSYNSFSSDDEASMTITGANVEHTGVNSNQHLLSKKGYLGSNTSLGRNNRDANIPVRAVSPRVRWVEDKRIEDQYGTRQMSASQQNLATTEDVWATVRSPSRASQQPIRAVSPRIRRNTENNDLAKDHQRFKDQLPDIPSAGELLGRTHEELVLLLIQLRRRHAATHRAIEQCCAQITSIEDCLASLKALEREESLQRLEQLKMQLMELEHQYEKSKPLVQLVDNMVKLGSFYNKPGSTMERLERNQRLRHKVLTEHAMEQQRWLESAAAGKPLETEAARARVAELWALEQELADEAAILQGLKTDKDTIETLLSGVRGRFSNLQVNETTHSEDLEAELARVHAMLALNSKKLEQTVADNARLERELLSLRRALHTQRVSPAPAHTHTHTAMLEDEVSRVQQLVSALQRQRQELSRAVRHLTQQSQALQTTHNSLPNSKRRPPNHQQWQETNLDSSHLDHNQSEYSDYDVMSPGHYDTSVEMPLFVDTRGGADLSPMTSEEQGGFGNLSNVEKQEIKTVRIVKRESERRQRDRERSLQPMSDWPTTISTMEQYLEEDIQPQNYQRSQSVPRTDFSKFEEYHSRPQEPPNYLKINTNMEVSPKYPSSPSLSNYDYSKDISSLNSSYNKSYDRSGYDRTVSISTQYLNSPTDSSKTLTNNLSKTSSIGSLTRSHMELSPIFKSEAAKQIITEMAGEPVKNGSLHRRQVPKEKRRHNTAPHHLSAKTLNELPKDLFNQDKLGRSLDDTDMERALRAPPDVVRSALAPQRFAENIIDQLLAAPQKILIPERYIPEKPPELSPEEQQKRKEKVESIKKMLSSSSADPNKSPDTEEKKQKEHLLQMNQILAKQVTEMSKIIAEKAIQELPLRTNHNDFDDHSPDVELPIYQQRDNFFS